MHSYKYLFLPKYLNVKNLFAPSSFYIKHKIKRRKPLVNLKRVGVFFGLSYVFTELLRKHRWNLSVSNFEFPTVLALSKTESKSVSNRRSQFNFIADVAEKTSPSVVYIEIVARHPHSREIIPISNGSGFIVKSDGLILTNAHVVQNLGYNNHVIVKLFNGEQYKGVVENYDSESDLATVRIQAKDLPVLDFGKSSEIRAGEFVIAMGNPLTLSHTITAGVVSSPLRAGKELGLHNQTDYIQTDAAVNVGNSGGPLVNLDCEVIGINTIKVSEGISLAIPSDHAVKFLEKVQDIKKRFAHVKSEIPKTRKYLGITMLSLTSTIIHELQQRDSEFPSVSHGVLVWRVMFNSPCYDAGIKPGDIITAINGKNILSTSDIYTVLQTEDLLHIHIKRKKKDFDITVKLVDPVFN